MINDCFFQHNYLSIGNDDQIYSHIDCKMQQCLESFVNIVSHVGQRLFASYFSTSLSKLNFYEGMLTFPGFLNAASIKNMFTTKK